MAFEIKREIPRIGQRAELLVAWYLRFNGFFPLANFILHDAGATKAPGQQLAEADVLALRLPFTKEIISAPDGAICTATDPQLHVREGTTDFLIVEVSSEECKFNWLDKAEEEQRLFLEYALRRFGRWSEPKIAAITKKIITDQFWRSGRARVRLLSVGTQKNTSAHWPDMIEQITFKETLEYLRTLFSCYGKKPSRASKYFVSDHGQWHPLISEIYCRLMGHKMQPQNPSEIVRWLFH